jgi:hypothetical protein
VRKHCDTGGELGNDGDLFAVLIKSFMDGESGKETRDRDPE